MKNVPGPLDVLENLVSYINRGYLKKEVKQEGAIQLHLGTALIIWGVIAIVVMELSPVFIRGGWIETRNKAVLAIGVFYLLVFGTGIILDWLLTKKKIEELGEVLDYTSRQIGKMWGFIPLFGGYLTIVLAIHGAFSFIYSMWMILVGAGMYFTGVFSRRYYEGYGVVLMVAGVATSLVPEGGGYFLSKTIAEVFLGGGLIVSGIYVKRRYGW